jgi:hypothetical protein
MSTKRGGQGLLSFYQSRSVVVILGYEKCILLDYHKSKDIGKDVGWLYIDFGKC